MEDELDLLLSVTGGLGRWQYVDDSKRVYVKDEDCFACLKDLARFLRRDDSDLREVFFKLGELQVVENDITPLLTTFPTDRELVYHSLKVLTFMTMPVDPMTANVPRQYAILASIKRCCLSRDVLAALMGLAAGPLSRHPRMSEEDHQALQLLLTFFRNLVSIPDPVVVANSAAGTSNMHEILLLNLFEESVMELVLLVAAHADERAFKADAPLLLDLLSEVYKGAEVQDVLNATEEAINQAKQKQEQERQAAARRAAAAAGSKPKSLAHQLLQGKNLTRHGRFKSTIVVTHKDTAALTYIHDASQQNMLEVPGIELETKVLAPKAQRASPHLLLALRHYTDMLLQGAYNVLMGQLRMELQQGVMISKLDASDFAKWFSLASWFSCYVRLQQEALYDSRKQRQEKQPQKDQQQQDREGEQAAAENGGSQQQQQPEASPFGAISATLCWATFKLARDTFREQADIPARSDQKNWELLHACTKLLREGLGVLELACKSGDHADKTAAYRMAHTLLHDTSPAGLLPGFASRIKGFSARHEPRSAAGVLVEAVHVILRLYDRLTARHDGQLLVKTKKRGGGGGRRKKRSPTPESEQDKDAAAEEQQQQQRKDGDVSDGQAAAAAGVHPGQEGGSTDSPDQQAGAVNGTDQAAAAAATIAGSEVIKGVIAGDAAGTPAADGPASSTGGTAAANEVVAAAGAAADSEPAGVQSPASLAAAPDAANSALPQLQPQQDLPANGTDGESHLAAGTAAAGGTSAKARRPVLEELEEEMSGSEDEEEEDTRHMEVPLDLPKMLRREMAVPAVVHFYNWMLAGYSSGNNAALNYAICSFLWRVILPEHLNLEPLLYQLSVLRIFHQLLSDASLRGKPEHKNVLLLATRVVRGLFAKIVPPPPAAAAGQGVNGKATAAEATGAAASSDGDDATAAEGGSNDQQQQQQQVEKEEREKRRQAAVAGMMCVEVMFWRHPNVCEIINGEYHLREEDMQYHDIGGRKGAGGLPTPKTMAPLLNPAGEEKLQTFFEKLCGDRANLDMLVRQMGGRLGRRQIASELKRLDLKFGELPPSLLPKLHQLWQKHRGGAIKDVVAAIATELPGGWRANQVRKLLKNEGLIGGGGRLQHRGGDSTDTDGWDVTRDVGAGDVLFDVDKARLESLYQQYLVEEDYLEQIAAAVGEDTRPADVLATLRFHDIVSKPESRGKKRAAGGAGRRRGGTDTRRISKDLLQSLWEQHGSSGANGLNIIAMALGLPVIEVQKLLQKHRITDRNSSDADSSEDDDDDAGHVGDNSEDEGGKIRKRHCRRAASDTPSRRMPVSREQLQQLYEQCKPGGADAAVAVADEEGDETYLENIAEQLPIPATTQQVLQWLRDSGIIPKRKKSTSKLAAAAAGRKKRSSLADIMEEDGMSDDELVAAAGKRSTLVAVAAAAAAVPRRVRGEVPEPQPLQLLGYLEALQRAYREDNRWMDAAGAVSWLLGKMDAAEEAWSEAAKLLGASAVAADYALVPDGDEAMKFFCSDWSNEMLVAAGIRNDNNDYFKIPGNSTLAWRNRVRDALKGALDKISSDDAAAACDVVMEEAAAAAAVEKACEEAAAAAERDKLVAVSQGAGFGGNQGASAAAIVSDKGRKKGGQKVGKPPQQQKRGKGSKKAAPVDSSDDVWDSSDGEMQRRQRRQLQRTTDDDGASSSRDSDADRDSDMPRSDAYESDDDNHEQQGGKSSPAAAVVVGGTAGMKRPHSGAAAAAAGHQKKTKQSLTSNKKRRSAEIAGATAAASDSSDGSEENRTTNAAAVGRAGSSRITKKQKGFAESVEDGGANARRSALQEITRRRQQQQHSKVAPAAAAVVKPRMIELDDDLDDLIDEGALMDDDVEVAAAAAGKVAEATAAAGGGRAGRAAMRLLDDDDD